MNTIGRAFVTALGVASLSALASPVRAVAQQSQPKPATVTVDNTRPVPVTVYIDHGPFDLRVGTVGPHAKATLALPGDLEEGETVQIFVHPEEGQDLASQDVTIHEGQNVDVYVPTNDAGYLPPPPPETIPNPGPGTTTVTVHNPRNEPVVVFVEQGPFDTRIGTVPANQEKTLMIPRSLVRDNPGVEIVLHPEGGVDLASQYLDLTKGDHLLIEVPKR